MKLKLIIPTKEYELQWKEYVLEYINNDNNSLPLEYQKDTNYSKWLKLLADERKGINLKKGRVPSTKYFLIDDNKNILGGISIRHSIDTKFLSNYGGHIGYGIKPTERGKGYGNMILALGLKKIKKMNVRKILITCFDDNENSKKIIEKNGGKLENKISFENKLMCRYYIEI